MAICPFATTRLLPESATQAHMNPTTIVLHSQGGHGSLYGMFSGSSNLESHFWVAEDGRIEQYMDTNTRADHAWDANGFSVGIESESSVQATEPWAPAQLASITKLTDWICTAHGIPRAVATSDHGPGIGWHCLFDAWNHSHHACPGAARVEQIKNFIIPAVAHTPGPLPPTKGPLMALTDQEQKELLDLTRENHILLQQQQHDTRTWVANTLGWARAIGARVGASKPDAEKNDPTH